MEGNAVRRRPRTCSTAWASITWLLDKASVAVGVLRRARTRACSPSARRPGRRRRRARGWRSPASGTSPTRTRWTRSGPIPTSSSGPPTGTLPAVSWVVPFKGTSEHPTHPINQGQAWVTQVVNAVMQGPPEQWQHTAIFVTWDDWGGFYDHVKPPVIDHWGYGLRVPGSRDQPVGRPVQRHRRPDAVVRRVPQADRGPVPRWPAADGQNEGWPDPRPTVREAVPQLGDLAKEFDFSQQPIPPLVLDPNPHADPNVTLVPTVPPSASP